MILVFGKSSILGYSRLTKYKPQYIDPVLYHYGHFKSQVLQSITKLIFNYIRVSHHVELSFILLIFLIQRLRTKSQIHRIVCGKKKCHIPGWMEYVSIYPLIIISVSVNKQITIWISINSGVLNRKVRSKRDLDLAVLI